MESLTIQGVPCIAIDHTPFSDHTKFALSVLSTDLLYMLVKDLAFQSTSFNINERSEL